MMQTVKMKLKSWHGNTVYLLCEKVQSENTKGKVYNGFIVTGVFALIINDFLIHERITYLPTKRTGLIGLYYTENELAIFDENEPVKIIL